MDWRDGRRKGAMEGWRGIAMEGGKERKKDKKKE